MEQYHELINVVIFSILIFFYFVLVSFVSKYLIFLALNFFILIMSFLVKHPSGFLWDLSIWVSMFSTIIILIFIYRTCYFYHYRAPKGIDITIIKNYNYFKFENTTTFHQYFSYYYSQLHLDFEGRFYKLLRYFPLLLPKEVCSSLEALKEINQEFYEEKVNGTSEFTLCCYSYSYVENRIFQSSATIISIKQDQLAPRHLVYLLLWDSVNDFFPHCTYRWGDEYRIVLLLQRVIQKMQKENFLDSTKADQELEWCKNRILQLRSFC